MRWIGKEWMVETHLLYDSLKKFFTFKKIFLMNRTIILSTLAAVILLYSCKKNDSSSSGPTNPVDTTIVVEKGILKGLRINTLDYQGLYSPTADSIRYNFTYNTQNNIRNINVILKQGFAVGNNNFSYTRNTDEVVTSWNLTPANTTGKVYYNTTTKKYTAFTRPVSSPDVDSVVLVYTGNNLTELLKYCTKCTGGPNALSNRAVLTYDAAGNLKQIDEYSGGALNPVLVYREAYEYDNKKNPLQINPEIWFLTGAFTYKTTSNDVFIGPNNVTKRTYYAYFDTTQNSIIDYNYTYNTNLYPIKATGKKAGKNYTETTYLY